MKKFSLLYGINDDELYTLLECCTSGQMLCEDGEYIFRMGEPVNKVLILLRGKACATQENFWGHQEHIYHIEEGGLSSQSYFRVRTPALPASVMAEGGCETLFLNYQRMIMSCLLACDFHTRLIHNMLRLVSEHNVKLENRLEHVCRRTTREKLLFYLSEQAMAKGGRDFGIPHNRQELAEYLCADRSVMSSELSKMRVEGILNFQKSHFMPHDRGTRDHREGAQG